MNLDGSDVTQLTRDPALQARGLDWSPDGEYIVYVSDQNGTSELYVMPANGSGQTRLSDNEAWDFMPTWSPDGQWLAYYYYYDALSPNYGLYAIRTDGSNALPQPLVSDRAIFPFGLAQWLPD